jgi:hypothetical protein
MRAHEAIDAALDGTWCKIFEPTRSDRQNAKLHAMITEMQGQVEALAVHSVEDIKLQFMNALRDELRFLPRLDGQGKFPVGQRTRDLTKAQFAGLLELLHEYAARNGVVFKTKEYD